MSQSQLLVDAGLPPRSPFYVGSFLRETQVYSGSPISSNGFLWSATPSPVLAMSIPSQWLGDKRWLQVSTGWFIPPVTTFYMFGAWHDASGHGHVG